MIFADTSYWIGLLSKDDELHDLCVDQAHRLSDAVVTTEYVLIETANHLSSPVYRLRVSRLYHDLSEQDGYCFQMASPELFRDGLHLYASRQDKHWSLTDCISFVLMDRLGITRALTFDHHFEQAGYEAILRRHSH